MTKIAKLEADLVANTSRFESGLKRADRTLSTSRGNWLRDLKKTEFGFGGLAAGVMKFSGGIGALTATISTLVGGAGIAAITTSAISSASAISDMSDRLQVSTGDLQAYQYAAKLVGIENSQLEAAMTRLNAKIADGKLHYKNASEAINSIAEEVRTAKDDTERLSIVNEAFGNKMGAKLLPLLADGADGLARLRQEAQETGNIISDEVIRKTDAFGDSLDILGGTITKNFQAGFLGNLISESGDLRDIYTDPEFVSGMQAVGDKVGEIASAAANAIIFVGGFAGKMKELKNEAAAFSDELDQSFFSALDNLDKKMGRNPRISQQELRSRSKYSRDSSLLQEYQSQNKAMQDAMRQAETNKPVRGGLGGDDKAIKARQSLLDSLKQENDLLLIQTSMYGQKESAIERAKRELQINNQLSQQGIVLSKEQQKQVELYLDSIQRQTELQDEQSKLQDKLKEKERDRQQALQQLTMTVQSGFEDAILSGEKLSDVLDGLLQDILKLLVRTSITEPIFGALTDKDSGFGNFLSGLLPSFDVGTPYVPHDMVAKIHKGERILTADENRSLMSGGSGGEVVVNIVNNAGAKVSSSSSKMPTGTELNILIDEATAENVSRPGSKTNRALSALSNRTLVRR